MRLAHFSDIHLLSIDGVRWLDLANKRWIGRMNLISNRSRHYLVEAFEDMVDDLNAQGIDHVLCTGDVTNLALEQEFRFARTHFDRLALGPEHVTVIPGNHDAYVAEGARFFTEQFGAYFAPDPGWGWPAPAAGGASADVAAADARTAEHWPVVRVRGDLALIALSTSLATPWFTAYGKVGALQLDRLRAVLADPRLVGKARVVAIHHPPAGKRAHSRVRGLRDHADFAAVIAEAGADLVVHGHEHRDMREALPGPGGPVPVLGVQSGTYGAHDESRTARYRVIEIEGGKVVSQHLRVWHRARKVFARDEAQPLLLAHDAPR